MPTDEQCTIMREKVLEKTDENFSRIQKTMEVRNEKIMDKLTQISDSLIKNNVHTRSISKIQEKVLGIIEIHEKEISGIKSNYKSLMKAGAVAMVLLPIIWSLLTHIYLGDIMTQKKVEEIIVDLIDDKYLIDE